ncbi:hypothetical protein Mh1964_24200 [Mannheimia haemolytica]
MFNLFKRPYSKEDFEDWSKFCYDLAKVRYYVAVAQRFHPLDKLKS